VQAIGGLEAQRLIYLGFDYAGVEVALRLAAIKTNPELFAGLRIMEQAALEELNRP
jgi:hypothetical protein